MNGTVLACGRSDCKGTLTMSLTSLVLSIVAAAIVNAQQWSPPNPTNLQVLPKDTAPRAVVMTMRSFAMGLGVRCQHCHVYKGDNPDDLNTFDFANDEKAPSRPRVQCFGWSWRSTASTSRASGTPPPGELR
jgi:hypothetical protein